MLSPTDAALGQAVVSNPRVPGLIRRSLDAESGLNDGLALPFLTMAIALGEAEAGGSPDGGWLWFTVRTILVSLAVGAAVGYGSGRLYRWSASAKRMGAGWDRLTLLALAVVSFAAVDRLDGSGFIGAFVAGAVLGTVAPATRPRAEAWAARRDNCSCSSSSPCSAPHSCGRPSRVSTARCCCTRCCR